jgi:hypothetical protein
VSAHCAVNAKTYTDLPSAYITRPNRPTPVRPTSIRTEQRMGGLMAGFGIIGLACRRSGMFARPRRFRILVPGRLAVCPQASWFGCMSRRALHEARFGSGEMVGSGAR